LSAPSLWRPLRTPIFRNLLFADVMPRGSLTPHFTIASHRCGFNGGEKRRLAIEQQPSATNRSATG